MRYIIELDMIQTIGIAVIFLILGIKLKKKTKLLQKYCIPNPVIGGDNIFCNIINIKIFKDCRI